MTQYTFDAVRWCDSMKIAHFRNKDFATAENFKQTRLEIERLRAELASLKAAAVPVADWWRKERLVASPPYLPNHVVLGTDGPEAVSTAQLDAISALVGEG